MTSSQVTVQIGPNTFFDLDNAKKIIRIQNGRVQWTVNGCSVWSKMVPKPRRVIVEIISFNFIVESKSALA